MEEVFHISYQGFVCTAFVFRADWAVQHELTKEKARDWEVKQRDREGIERFVMREEIKSPRAESSASFIEISRGNQKQDQGSRGQKSKVQERTRLMKWESVSKEGMIIAEEGQKKRLPFTLPSYLISVC